MQETKVIKILVVGDSGVGKTSLINRYNSNLFDLNINSTIGVDFAIKNFQKNNTRYRVQFWDVAGQERYKSISKLFVRNSSACLVVCDVTMEKSLNSLTEWKEVVENNLDTQLEREKIPILVAANKFDLLKEEQNLKEIIEKLEVIKKKKNHHQIFKENMENNLDHIAEKIEFIPNSDSYKSEKSENKDFLEIDAKNEALKNKEEIHKNANNSENLNLIIDASFEEQNNYFFTSARTKFNVECCFEKVIEKAIDFFEDKKKEEKKNLEGNDNIEVERNKLDEKEGKKTKCCSLLF